MTELEQALAKVKELEAANVKLSEDKMAAEQKLAAAPPPAPAKSPEEQSEIDALKKQIADLQSQLAKAQADNEMMMQEKKAADAAKCMAEKKQAFQVLLTEGKACAAQEKAFIEGNMDEFIKLAQPLNLKAQGSSDQGSDESAEKVIKLAEEKIKANPKMTKFEAISLAKRELKL